MGQPFENKGCKKKVRYRDELAAMVGKSKVEHLYGDLMEIYRCKFCKGYHLSNKQKVSE